MTTWVKLTDGQWRAHFDTAEQALAALPQAVLGRSLIYMAVHKLDDYNETPGGLDVYVTYGE